MFPFPQNNDSQDFGAPAPYNNLLIPDNLILGDLINEGHHEGFLGCGIDHLIPTTSNQGERLISFEIQENEEKIGSDEVTNSKRFVNREIERNRRQQMGKLCGSLRDLLPLQYVQGKRSMSDQLEGAVNYISDIQSNIHQLKSRRDKLKKLPNSGNTSHVHGEDNLPNCVTVNPCHDGVEILINTTFEDEQGLSLPRVLRELLERGFNVVSCFSTRADERSLHRIQLEASNPTLEDLSELQERLAYLINCPY